MTFPFQKGAWNCITLCQLRGAPNLVYGNVNLAMVNSMMLHSSKLTFEKFEKVYYITAYPRSTHLS